MELYTDKCTTDNVCTWHAEKNGTWRQYSGFSLSEEQLLMYLTNVESTKQNDVMH